MVGGLFSLIWCLVVLTICMRQRTPVTSLFGDIDFASKLLPEAQPFINSVPPLTSSLSMASTCKIRRELAPVRFHVQWDSVPSPDTRRRSGNSTEDNIGYDSDSMKSE